MTPHWAQINQLDFSDIKSKLSEKKGFWWRLTHKLDRIEEEYRQFLYLIATNPGKTVVPWSQPLDDFWHEHILDTHKYTADCQQIFGQYIHHNPHLNVGTEDQKKAFSETKVMYRAAFQELADKKKQGATGDSSSGCGAFSVIVFCGSGSDAGGADAGGGDAGGDAGGGCGGGGCGGGGD
jgi:hypothetical protein